MAINKPAVIKLPDLPSKEGVVDWAHNLVRTLQTWMEKRPVISTGKVTFSFDPLVTTTSIMDMFAHPDSHINLTPKNANAAGALGTGWYVSNRTGGQVDIAHQASSTTRSYTYMIVS
jgi:predicted Zn-dependent protease